MINIQGNEIELSWKKETLFEQVSEQTLYALITKDIESEEFTITVDERFFFNSAIKEASSGIAEVFARVLTDKPLVLDSKESVMLTFYSRHNVVPHYNKGELSIIDNLAEQFLYNFVLSRWYAVKGVESLATIFQSKLEGIRTALQKNLFTHFRPAPTGAGYQVMTVTGGSPQKNGSLHGIESIGRTEAGEVIVKFTDGSVTSLGYMKGDDGEKGDKGNDGEKGDRGSDGKKGDTGEKGASFRYEDFTPLQLENLRGNSSYELAVKNGYKGTELQYCLSYQEGTPLLPSLEVKIEADAIGKEGKSWLWVRFGGLPTTSKPLLSGNIRIAIARHVFASGCNSERWKRKDFKGYSIPHVIGHTGKNNPFIKLGSDFLAGKWQKVMVVDDIADIFIKETAPSEGGIIISATRRSRRKISSSTKDTKPRPVSIRIGVCLVEVGGRNGRSVLTRGAITPLTTMKEFRLRQGKYYVRPALRM